MEVYQPLDFSSSSMPMSAMGTMLPSSHSPHSPHSPRGHQAVSAMSVLDLCVRRPSPVHSPQSPHSPRSPRSPLYHPYHIANNNNNNNNNNKSVNQNEIQSQLLIRAKMEMDATSRASLPSLPSPPAYPHAELPDGSGQVTGVPTLSVLQQRLLPRSATSAFVPAQPSAPSPASLGSLVTGLPTIPAPRRRRTSSGLPDSPLGSSDDRSSTAASPPPSPPSMDLLNSLAPLGGLGSLGTPLGPLGSPYPTALPAISPTGLAMPQQIVGSATPSGAGRNGKPTRPFKAYPKDPLSLAAGVQVGGSLGAAEAALGRASNEAYAEFRRRMLAQVQAAIPSKAKKSDKQLERAASPTQLPDDSPTTTTIIPTAITLTTPTSGADSSNTSSPESTTITTNLAGDGPGTPDESKDGKDAAYWERRRKNNEAAKRSRDARRAKEDEIAIRAAFLEQENLNLKYEVAALRSETAKLRCLLYSGGAEC